MIRVFLSYAHVDQQYKDVLYKHLTALGRIMPINVWADNELLPGVDFKHEILSQIKDSQIILLMVSPDFIVSNFCYTTEMTEAFNLQRLNKLLIIPIITRHVSVDGHPFASLQYLPKNPACISDWPDQDAACEQIIGDIKNLVDNYIVDIVNFKKSEIEEQVESGNILEACNKLMDFAKDFAKDKTNQYQAMAIKAAYCNIATRKTDDFTELCKVSMQILQLSDTIAPPSALSVAA